jgi:hypothetical protein
MPNKPQGHKVGRNNATGRLVPLPVAKAHPKTNSIEIMPNPGRGDTGRSSSKKSK